MSEHFNIEIVNPEKSFLSKENVSEVVIPAFEGEIGILKDHIPIISFLKPGIIKVFTGTEEENYYVEDGIVEFKDNSLSILTSSIFNLKDIDNNHINNSILEAEKELSKDEIDDQKRFLLNHKVEVLKSLSIN
jgi:ATP synthase F1 epsilon subunit|tara:strand:- start:206 stop:604 length:399 start_codon:yes stop_codon:yes gene_type:complete